MGAKARHVPSSCHGVYGGPLAIPRISLAFPNDSLGWHLWIPMARRRPDGEYAIPKDMRGSVLGSCCKDVAVSHIRRRIVKIKRKMEVSTDCKGVGLLSKKKYSMLEEEIQQVINKEEAEQIMGIIRRVLKFDPTANTYMSVKEKAGETGTTYTKYSKAYYEKNKERLNKNRQERRKKIT